MKRIRNALALLGLLIAVSVSTQVGIDRARAAFWQWSQSASLNGNSDPNINWAEGMPPSVVNDSARAMMAALASQAADTSGGLQTAGGPTAFTVTTNQGFPNPPLDGQLIGVTFNVNSSGTPTLAVDGGTAYPIDSAIGTAANVGVGTPVTLVYNAANSIWLVRGGGGGGVPLGGVVAYTGNTVPSTSWVFAFGECISTTTYATYWVLIGSPAPGSCAAGQFAVLDLRGMVLAGLDTMPGSAAAGRLTSATKGCGTAMTAVGATCANGNQSHTLSAGEMPVHNHTAGIYDPGHSHTLALGVNNIAQTDVTGGDAMNLTGSMTTSTNTTGVQINSSNGIGITENAGGGQAHSIVMPTTGVIYIIRVQ